MTHNKLPPKNTPTTNAYLQPLIIAFLASAFGFSYSFYSNGELGLALALSAIEFVVLFWIVWQGNRLLPNRGKSLDDAGSGNRSLSYPQMLKWGAVAMALCVVLGISIFAYREIRDANDRRAKAEQQRQQEEDDLVVRTRKISNAFYSDMSNNPHPLFESGVDAAIAALEFPILSIEKNWPKGPTIVVYKGTAKDAEKIYMALRSQGVPISGYGFMPVK